MSAAAVPLPEQKEESKQQPQPSSMPKTLSTLTFDNAVLRALPVGREGQRGTLFSLVETTPLLNPRIVSLSSDGLALLELTVDSVLSDPNSAAFLAGNLPIPGSQSASHCYCGHQFGAFAGQLGDGAVCYQGEVINNRDERWELQFKGSGLTPYSRSADGRKVLRSSMREFLASEAMHALGIPTTRSASLVTSDTLILRDQFYTGDVRRERASVITRIAQSFIRFGSFEVCKTRDPRTGASGPCVGTTDVLRRMMDYLTAAFFPEQAGMEAGGTRDVAVYVEIVQRTARLVAQWQCVGFIHGVLNTDNMSVLGLTLDYGPFQWMDAYLPSSTSNTSDDQFRYAYDRQRSIGKWNLAKLAEAFALMWDEGTRQPALQQMMELLELHYDSEFDRTYNATMAKKLGLRDSPVQDVQRWTSGVLDVLERTAADFTNAFRILSTLSLQKDNSATVIDYLTAQSASLSTYRDSLAPRIDPDQLVYYEHLLATNPNIRDSSGMIAAEKQRTVHRQTASTLTDSTKQQRDRALWSAFIAEYRTHQLTLWRADEEAERRQSMNAVNPKYVLRNWMAQMAIEKAEEGDYGECNELLNVLRDPYAIEEDEVVVREGEAKAREVEDGKGAGRYTCKPPKDYENVLCSCSS